MSHHHHAPWICLTFAAIVTSFFSSGGQPERAGPMHPQRFPVPWPHSSAQPVPTSRCGQSCERRISARLSYRLPFSGLRVPQVSSWRPRLDHNESPYEYIIQFHFLCPCRLATISSAAFSAPILSALQRLCSHSRSGSIGMTTLRPRCTWGSSGSIWRSVLSETPSAAAASLGRSARRSGLEESGWFDISASGPAREDHSDGFGQ